MTLDARDVYAHHAGDYDALVRHEDRAANVLREIQSLVALAGAEVVELGAGTGRVTALLAPHVRAVRAYDSAPAMLAVARARLAELGVSNCDLEVADNASLPADTGTADLAIAGWTYGHQTVWHPTAWREPIERALSEMMRVLRPGGTAIVIETLGTGHESPFDPPAALGRYYALLGERGFERRWTRTDYEFPSIPEGERLVRLFFGDALADAFVAAGARQLPECTGVWWRRR